MSARRPPLCRVPVLQSCITPEVFATPPLFGDVTTYNATVPLTVEDGENAGLMILWGTSMSLFARGMGFVVSVLMLVFATVTQVAAQAVPAPTTTTITASPSTAVRGTVITYTVTVTSTAGTPTGTVGVGGPSGADTFTLDANGVATLTSDQIVTLVYPLGANNIVANYNGAAGFATSSGNTVVQLTAIPTTTTIESSVNPSAPGQDVTWTVNVTSADPARTPEGTISIGSPIGSNTFPLVNGSVAIDMSDIAPPAVLPLGSNQITVTYNPKAITFYGEGFSHATSNASLVQNVSVPLPATTTTLDSSLNPSNAGDLVTFTATVSTTAADSVSGVVEFRDGTTVLCSVSLSANSASCPTSALTAGGHPITAVYLGDPGKFLGSTSNLVNQQVNTVIVGTPPKLDEIQEKATGVAAQLASEMITESVGEEIAAALSGQTQVLSASEGKVGLVYSHGIGNGSVITPTADLATGKNDIASWRIWSSLRYTDFDSSKLDGDQINALLGASFLFGDGLVGGLVAGYENQDYEDDVNARLKGEGFNIGGYFGGSIDGGLRFDAQVHASFLDYDMANVTTTGSTDGTRLIVGGGVAHTLQFGALTIDPTARFSGTWEWQDAYTDSAATTYDSRAFNSGRITAGAKIAHRMDMGDGTTFSPFVTGFGDYRFSGGDMTEETLLDGLSARAGLGFEVRAANGISASALGEISGLGLSNNAMMKSFKVQVAVPF
jgi:hypothetical protein